MIRDPQDIDQLVTLARLAPPPKRFWRAGGWRGASRLAMTARDISVFYQH